MSNTIAARDNRRVLQPFLFQKSAGELIEAVESQALGEACLSVREKASFAVASFSGFPDNRATGAVGNVVLFNAGYATGSHIREPQATCQSGWTLWARMVKTLLQSVKADSEVLKYSAAQLRVDRLTEIQTSFGLSTLVLADVLAITRQGLYKWLDATRDITLQESSRHRLAVVESLSKVWQQQCKAPLSSVAHEPVAGGRTVLEMLKEPTLVEEDVTAAFGELAAKFRDKPKSLSQRMAEAGYTRRPSARALPSDE